MFLKFIKEKFHSSNSHKLGEKDHTPSPTKKIENINVALALGCGGSRGMAHVGVIEVLKENNIPIDLIVGVSSGSAVGALYADSRDIDKIKALLLNIKSKELLDFSLKNFFNMLIKPVTPYTGQAYEDFLFKNMESKEFSELKIPLVVVTTDINTGKKLIIDQGSIAPAVRASSAIPPVLSPVKLFNKTLIDGGILEPVPVLTAKLYDPKLVIAVDINSGPPSKVIKNIWDLTYKAYWFSYYELSRIQAKMADIDIHADYSDYGFFEDDHREELYQIGKEAALKMLPYIKQKLEQLK